MGRHTGGVLIAGLVLVAVAALIHTYAFYTQTVADAVPAADGTGKRRSQALDQGLYNVFLAIAVVMGIVVVLLGQDAVGGTLIVVAAGGMALLGLALAATDRSMIPTALVQIIPAVAGGVLVLLGVL